jgi:hypothetical protein
MAGGQGIQPLVIQPVIAAVVADCLSDGDTFGNPLPIGSGAMSPHGAPSTPAPSYADAQSDLGVRCAIAWIPWIASPRSVSLARCS